MNNSDFADPSDLQIRPIADPSDPSRTEGANARGQSILGGIMGPPAILCMAWLVPVVYSADVTVIHAASTQGGLFSVVAALFIVAFAVTTLRMPSEAAVAVHESAVVPSLSVHAPESLPALQSPAPSPPSQPPSPPTPPPPLEEAVPQPVTSQQMSLLEAERILDAEQRLLEAFGIDEAEEAEGISADDIAAFKAAHGGHRRTASGSVKEAPLLKYKDRADSEPLCDVISRWQKQSPTSASLTSEDKDSQRPMRRPSRSSSKRYSSRR